MKLTLVSALAAVAVFVAPAVATPPACLLLCVQETARSSSQCNALKDIVCMCSNESSSLQQCLDQKCPNGDADAAKSAFESACQNAGSKAQSVDSSSSSSSSSTASSSSAAPETSSATSSSVAPQETTTVPSPTSSEAPEPSTTSTSAEPTSTTTTQAPEPTTTSSRVPQVSSFTNAAAANMENSFGLALALVGGLLI